MAFVVTARKWRPNKFDDVVGQEHITSTLKNAIRTNRIAHAYIFTGPRGVGKTTTARILAKTLNCLNPVDFEPCNNCEMCNSIQNNQSLDIIEMDAASNRGIEEIRTLRDSVKYSPSRGKYKVYIIDEVHMLTRESFNAFLKTLEEPPAHTIFIFATTDIHKVPLTIISRCQRFDFRRIQLNTIKELLLKIAVAEKIEIDDKTLTVIARKADGALRDAESFFDQVVSFCGNKIDFETTSKMLNLIDDEVYFRISDAILSKNFSEVFRVSEIMYNNGYDFTDFMNGLLEHFRNILTVLVTGKTDFLETAEIFRKRYLDYKEQFSQGDLLRILSFINKTIQEMRFSQNLRLKIEISLSHLIGLEKTSTISELIENIDTSDEILKDVEKKNYKPISTLNNLSQRNQNISSSESPSSSNSTKSTSSENEKELSVPKSEVSKEFNKEVLLEYWDTFVSAVLAEKKLFLGSYITALQIKNVEGNKVTMLIPDELGRKNLQMSSDFLEKKSLQIFGRRLKFIFEAEEQTGNPAKSAKIKPLGEENDPIAKLIIEDLGGEEIS